MANATGEQGKKNGLLTQAWDAEEPEIVKWEAEGDLPLHTCACDIYGNPIQLGHDLAELRAFGLHIDPSERPTGVRRSWRAADHEAPFDENELPRIYWEAGAHHSLSNVLPSANSRFMIPGDPTSLSKSYKDIIAESLP
jgi:hypothetical protein